jgi:hypothetical protein
MGKSNHALHALHRGGEETIERSAGGRLERSPASLR